MRNLAFAEVGSVSGGFWEDDGYGNQTWYEDSEKRRVITAGEKLYEAVRVPVGTFAGWVASNMAWDAIKDQYSAGNTSEKPLGSTNEGSGQVGDYAGASYDGGGSEGVKFFV